MQRQIAMPSSASAVLGQPAAPEPASASTTTAVDTTGRVVLPASVRRRLNLTPGARLQVRVVAGHIELVPEPAGGPALSRTGGRLVLAATGKPFDAAAAVRSERELQARRGRRG
jgi:AbrB family looped-hinge helix DNA binding protein